MERMNFVSRRLRVVGVVVFWYRTARVVLVVPLLSCLLLVA